ncbi:MAG: glycoside hydrolase family 28 protein [Bacteroidales bacterium]|nr:glycoside hydrolase family 28 protein [Bacteroidales bacterium]MBN2698498.1 glycoside hydrolase family 28 protein [Bacteroidales bacterium]
MKHTKIISCSSLLIIASCFCILTIRAEDPAWSKDVGARLFPEAETMYCVNDHGVKPGLASMTAEIQSVIDDCSSSGGGTVWFKPGEYVSGALFLKEGVHLRIDSGVVIRGRMDLSEYPDIDTRVAGIEMIWPAALINVIEQRNVAITGNGVIHAQGRWCWEDYWTLRKAYEKKGIRWAADYDSKRVRTILISGSSDITVSGLTLKQAAFWTVHVLYSDHVTLKGLVIQNNIDGHGPSTDGIDIDSSSRILVEECDIDCNDDNFCLKAGRDADGLRVNRPTEYVVIRNCISRAGGGLITFGSETSGGIRHVIAYNLKAEGTTVGIRFKSAMIRGGTIKDIHIHDVEMERVGTAISATTDWNPNYSYPVLPETFTEIPPHWKVMLERVEPPEKGIPYFRDITISNLVIQSARTAIQASGSGNSLLENFTLENLLVNARNPGKIEYARNWSIRNVRINTESGRDVEIVNSEGVKF